MQVIVARNEGSGCDNEGFMVLFPDRPSRIDAATTHYTLSMATITSSKTTARVKVDVERNLLVDAVFRFVNSLVDGSPYQ